MKCHLLALACLSLSLGVAAAEVQHSGIDASAHDVAIRPQDNFYQYVNGGWLRAAQIPADGERITPSSELDAIIRQRLKGIIEGPQPEAAELRPDWQKMTRLYRSYLDESRLESLRSTPLADLRQQIAQADTPEKLCLAMGELGRLWVMSPFSNSVLNDADDPSIYAVTISQNGLGLPDRDYYLEKGAPFEQARAAYVKHLATLLRLDGDTRAKEHAPAVMALETQLAKAQWSGADSSDPTKTNNRIRIDTLAQTMPSLDWSAYLKGAGIAGRIDNIVVAQPGYYEAVGKLLHSVPADTWQAYLRTQMLTAYATYLSRVFVEEDFAFNSRVLRGIKVNTPRWQRGMDLIEASMGEGLGRQYVAQYFSPASKARLQHMVDMLVLAAREEIDEADWMEPQTRARAKEKLSTLHVKIGYPDRWRDYSQLDIRAGDLVGNVRRARSFEYNRNIGKLGHAVDKDEWYITPQTVDAYQYPPQNEIVFPAGLMQPPFFDVDAEDAANYGAIGASIGHEISHGFDNIGSQYAADGRLLGKPGWFTTRDQARFDERAHAMAVQYDKVEVLPGHFINGQQTLSENVADNTGLAMAYRAYQLSLGGKPAPVIDGLTGDQRLYMAWTQKWRAKVRDNETIRLLRSNPHSPRQVRGQEALKNQDGFYRAFDIKPGDGMYLAPAQRVKLW
ncbi:MULTISPECIES: M13 family metallopeptidase [Dyella]|nr:MULTISPECIES: M13 family metallopeptidase [Dyella]